eukprot:CAMPEP_0194305928 /NCGR_PEP_ID=MMETSP0171-20130528/3240_1 /TAXON_ID=218684 /ORGANISM="Corethron pennatum, Strain L29A3" /LENGTH=186 /DNA_ID=CAMNT_0039057589 /DNA_START=97 /DNA_END=660 /DNA_ORIENTATION=-
MIPPATRIAAAVTEGLDSAVTMDAFGLGGHAADSRIVALVNDFDIGDLITDGKKCSEPKCLGPPNRTIDPCKDNYERLTNATNETSVSCFDAAPEGAPITTCSVPYWEGDWDIDDPYTCALSMGACFSIELFSPHKATCIDMGCEWEDAYCTGVDTDDATNTSSRVNSWLPLMAVGITTILWMLSS